MSPQQQLYDRWAPEGAVWSTWVKPVLFAKMPERRGAAGRHALGAGAVRRELGAAAHRRAYCDRC